MSELDAHLKGIQRQLAACSTPGGEAKVVSLRCIYPAPIEDVWEACTDKERLSRWFMPVSGDFREGGHYQLEGNAGGEILRCEAPRLLKVSWLFGENPGFSEVEVRLAPDGDGGTVLELEHTAVVDPAFWAQFGPGAVGLGWDLGLLGLGMFLGGAPVEDKEAWVASPEAIEFMTRSGEAWGAAHAASGAPADEVATAMNGTIGAYTAAPPDEDAPADA